MGVRFGVREKVEVRERVGGKVRRDRISVRMGLGE